MTIIKLSRNGRIEREFEAPSWFDFTVPEYHVPVPPAEPPLLVSDELRRERRGIDVYRKVVTSDWGHYQVVVYMWVRTDWYSWGTAEKGK